MIEPKRHRREDREDRPARRLPAWLVGRATRSTTRTPGRGPQEGPHRPQHPRQGARRDDEMATDGIDQRLDPRPPDREVLYELDSRAPILRAGEAALGVGLPAPERVARRWSAGPSGTASRRPARATTSAWSRRCSGPRRPRHHPDRPAADAARPPDPGCRPSACVRAGLIALRWRWVPVRCWSATRPRIGRPPTGPRAAGEDTPDKTDRQRRFVVPRPARECRGARKFAATPRVRSTREH